MNNLILELAKQAGLKSSSELEISIQEQKFAELLIKECVYTYDKFSNYHPGAFSMAKQNIKKQFNIT